MTTDQFGYAGKNVLVIGGATGMGAAAARLARERGARVAVMDVADIAFPVDQAIKVDLRDEASVDAALTQVRGPLHAVFACAGVADGVRGLMLINFIAQRKIIETLVADGRLGRGGAVAMISSVAGLGWLQNQPQCLEFLQQRDWVSAQAWVDAHAGTDNYMFSKQVMNTYIARQALPLLAQGIRINAILPGPTDTPLARANADQWLGFGAGYRQAAGVPPHPPEHMGNALLFLCSDAAAGVNGITLLVDYGHVSASMVDAYDEPAVKMMTGLA
jgi:NAD(P)-dependent dehydrogenase (short-subunit alcohol dehydrogenase family)